jgi:hypothetical protein
MIPEAGVAAAVQALAEGRRGHDVPQAALERQVECTRTQPIRNRTHSETYYSTFGQRTDVNFACKSSRLRATTEHPPEIASPPQRTIDHDRAPAISFLPAALVSARPPRSTHQKAAKIGFPPPGKVTKNIRGAPWPPCISRPGGSLPHGFKDKPLVRMENK